MILPKSIVVNPKTMAVITENYSLPLSLSTLVFWSALATSFQEPRINPRLDVHLSHSLKLSFIDIGHAMDSVSDPQTD